MGCTQQRAHCALHCTLARARDLWRITTFLREQGFDADVAACRETFPGMLSFADFLAATRWGDAGRSYEQGIEFTAPASEQRPASEAAAARAGGQA
jgi:hypothetical protein